MAEKYIDYTYAIKERMRSPMFSNFMVSWLIINWKIPYLTIFVSEDRLKVGTKLDAIIDLINQTSLWMLLYWPIASTIFMLFLYPFLFNWLEIVRLKFRKWLKEIHEQGDRDLLSLKIKYDILKEENAKLLENFTKELKYNVFHFENKIELFFAGKWDVEIYFNKAEKYSNCHYRGGAICNPDSILFYVSDLDKKSETVGIFDSSTLKIRIKSNDLVYDCEIYIRSRTFIEIFHVNNRDRKIILKWNGFS